MVVSSNIFDNSGINEKKHLSYQEQMNELICINNMVGHFSLRSYGILQSDKRKYSCSCILPNIELNRLSLHLYEVTLIFYYVY